MKLKRTIYIFFFLFVFPTLTDGEKTCDFKAKEECNEMITLEMSGKERLFNPGDFICSKNKTYRFGLTIDGVLAICYRDKKLWSVGFPNPSLFGKFQKSGKFVLYDSTLSPVWEIKTKTSQKATKLSLSNNGTLEVSDKSDNMLWSLSPEVEATTNSPSSTSPQGTIAPSDSLQPMSTIVPTLSKKGNSCNFEGESNATECTEGIYSWYSTRERRIDRGEFICNSDFLFGLNQDGVLSICSRNTGVVWSVSIPDDKEPEFAHYQRQGNLVLYDANSKPLWESGAKGNLNTDLYLSDTGRLSILNQKKEEISVIFEGLSPATSNLPSISPTSSHFPTGSPLSSSPTSSHSPTFNVTSLSPSLSMQPTMPKSEEYFNYDPNSRYGPIIGWDTQLGQHNFFDSFIDIGKPGRNHCGRSMQSPIDLVKEDECKDDHQIHTQRGSRNWKTIQFQVLPFALRALFDLSGRFKARADFSNLSQYVDATFMDVKIPSEHTMNGKQYLVEVQIGHRWLDSPDGDQKKINIGFFLDPTTDVFNPKMEEFIREWENISAERKYDCEKKSLKKGDKKSLATEILNTTLPLKTKKFKKPHKKRKKEERQRVFIPHDDRSGDADWDIYQLLPTVFYYGYEGSITYPPCSQHVIWRFLDLPGFLSWKQYHRLQKLVLEQVDEKDCKPVKVANPNGGINRPLQTNNYKTWRCRGWSIKHEEDFINAWPANYHGTKKLYD